MQPKIFVQIAAYRDAELQPTLKDMFDKALYPERVFAGIVWQAIPGTDDGLLDVTPWKDQIRLVTYEAKDSKGMGWARREAQKLWKDEEYLLQIDSHMRFEPAWDAKLVAQLAACPSKKAVLTCYPPAYTPPDNRVKNEMHIMGADKFDPPGILKFQGIPAGPNWSVPVPIPGMFIAGGFIFGPSSVLQDIPYDPCIYFYGDEISLAVRLWTHGYDIYHPNENVIYHYYKTAGDTSNRVHWADHENWTDLDRRSVARVRHLLGVEVVQDSATLEGLDQCGLGTERTLADYQALAGVDFKTGMISERARKADFSSAPLPVIAGMDASWVAWTQDNLNRGCNPLEVRDILYNANFPMPVVQAAMGERFPSDPTPFGGANPMQQQIMQMQQQLVQMQQQMNPNMMPQVMGPNPALHLVTPGVDHRALFEIPLLSLGRFGVKRVNTQKLQLLILDDFMTKDECDTLIQIMHKSLRPSTITIYKENYRTSKTSDLSLLNDPFVNMIDQRICDTMSINRAYSEGIQAQKYEVGQEFKEHTDFFEPGTDEFKEHGSIMGNRTWTFMVYLDNTPKGGGTKFFNINQIFYPKAGRALIWNSLHMDGTPVRDTLHAGLPVEEGEKHIITKWFRERGQGMMFA